MLTIISISRNRALALCACLVSGAVHAGTVTVPNSFYAGTPAKASEVNANFDAVATAVNGNAADIATINSNIASTNNVLSALPSAAGLDFVTISLTRIDVRTNGAVVAGTVVVSAPAEGYVLVRFDGFANGDAGDRIVLAASDNTTWESNDGNVNFNGDGNPHPFSHTRVYAVTAAGDYTYNAVVHNYVNVAGTGLASVHGILTAQYVPLRY